MKFESRISEIINFVNSSVFSLYSSISNNRDIFSKIIPHKMSVFYVEIIFKYYVNSKTKESLIGKSHFL